MIRYIVDDITVIRIILDNELYCFRYLLALLKVQKIIINK